MVDWRRAQRRDPVAAGEKPLHTQPDARPSRRRMWRRAAGRGARSLIAYMSSLTNRAFSATQYALFSSFWDALPGKLFGGFSGIMVDGLGYANSSPPPRPL